MKKILFILICSITLFGCNLPIKENVSDTASQETADKVIQLNEFYSKDGKNVYFVYGYVGGSEMRILENADPDTFEFFKPLGGHYYFAKDKSYVYRNGEKVNGVSGQNFEFLYGSRKDPLYAKDNKHVFILYEDLLSGHGNLNNFELLQNADPITFKFYEHNNCQSTNALYANDVNHAYFGSSLISGAEGKTFEHIALALAKDKNNVYFLGQPVKDSDPTTFEILVKEGQALDCSKIYAKDKNHVFNCFNECSVVKDANPKTFKP